MKKPEKCTSCGSHNLVQRRVARSFGARIEDVVVVRNLPVVVCRDCGETFIHAATLKQIAAIQQNRSKLQKKKLPVAQI